MKAKHEINTITALQNPNKNLVTEIKKYKYIYLLMLPTVVFYIIFKYIPIYGVQLSFKVFNAGRGIWGSPWIGLANFQRMIEEPGFLHALYNTVILSLIRIFGGCAWPVILAVLLNELRLTKYRKVMQTIYTFPHFLSWVLLSGIIYNLFGADGGINGILISAGLNPQNELTNPKTFRWFLLWTAIWKEVGWSSIIFLAALVGIDRTLYEAATIDGASRFQKMIYISLPAIYPIFSIGLILSFGNLLDGNFEQIFNLYNPTLYSVADTIDTYLYRISFMQTPSYGFSVAVGFSKAVANALILFAFNELQKILGGKGMFEGGVRE